MTIETFKIKIEDLQDLSHESEVTVKTFDGKIGKVTPRGIIIEESFTNDETGRRYTVKNRYSFKEYYSKIKNIKKGHTLIADRPYPFVNLMTKGSYQRPERSPDESKIR